MKRIKFINYKRINYTVFSPINALGIYLISKAFMGCLLEKSVKNRGFSILSFKFSKI